MQRFSFLAIVLGFGILTGCDDNVGYNYDRQADFSQFKTYTLVDIRGGMDKLNDLERRAVEQSVERGLAARGLTKATPETADLYAGIQVGMETSQEFTTVNMGGPWAMGPGWGPGMGWGMGMGMGGGISQTRSNTVITGTLVLDLYERAKKQLVWRGQVSRTVEPTRQPDRRVRNLDKAVAAMLKKYPPQSTR